MKTPLQLLFAMTFLTGGVSAVMANDEITGIIDILPTFCKIVGVEVPSDRIIDGKNLIH